MPSSLFHILNISRQDILSQLRDLDVTSNNLANAQTTGYKSVRSDFQEVFAQQLEGNRIVNTQTLTGQGQLTQTSNGLDWGIEGEGYFSITLPDGTTGYTRDGQLNVDSAGTLVTSRGYPLVWSGTTVKDQYDIRVATDGTVSAADAAGVRKDIGTVQLTRFPNPSGLTGYGDNVWLESDLSGAAQTGTPGTDTLGIIRGSTQEMSNVALTQELTHLITLQRSFSMSIKALQQTDSMIGGAITMRKA